MLYVRRDSDDVLEMLGSMLVENVSSDSEAEDLEMLYFLSAFGFTKEKGERFVIEKCDCPVPAYTFNCALPLHCPRINSADPPVSMSSKTRMDGIT